jgi:hypothetical protein
MTDAQLLEAREHREDKLLNKAIDESLELLFSEADTVGPRQRHQLRGLLRFYAKKAHPFRDCVRDNMKRFGPGGTEKVCATLKDIIRGTTHWRGHPELDHGAPGAVAASTPPIIDEETAELLLSLTEDQLGVLFSRGQNAVHEAGMHFAVSGSTIVEDADQDGLPDAPPPEADYRPAEVEAIACWNCAHFEKTGVNDADWPAGICHLWEAQVQGQNVCDRYTADPTMRDGVETHMAPQDEYGDIGYSLNEMWMSGGKIELAEEDGEGYVTKRILRTGKWNKTPGLSGVEQKAMEIVRDGASNAAERIVSLSELVQSFKDNAYQYVTIPLSDDEAKDHKNLLSLNQGFVKDLWIEDEDDTSYLTAKMLFTEADTFEKVKNGTYPDVSAGVYFNVERPDGKKFGSAVNHCCLTPRPFIDGLSPFAVMASDDDGGKEPEHIESFVPADEKPPEWDERLSFSWQREQLDSVLAERLSDDYTVGDISPGKAIIHSEIAKTSWVAPFVVQGEGVHLADVSEWQAREEEEEGSEQPSEPAAAPAKPITFAQGDELQQARTLRELRSRGNGNSEGGGTMPVSKTDPLDGIDFSNEDAVRSVVSKLAEDNASLRSKSREQEISEEIDRVKGLGFEDAPGFLRVYQDILESDDGEPAMILLAHDDRGREQGTSRPTASDIAKSLIDALPTEEKDGELKVALSAQHLVSGNDDPPPAEEETGDTKPVEERTREAAQAIGQKMPGESGGE